MKKFLLWVWRVLLALVTLAVLLFSLGTVFPLLPYIGSVANIAMVGYLHLWVPLCAALFLLALIRFFALRKERRGGLVLLCSAVSLVCAAAVLCGNWLTVSRAGMEPNVWPVKDDVSAVKTETMTWLQSEYGELLMDVHYTEDGETDKPVMVYIHGGGWIQGERTAHLYYSKAFAAHGYVVFCPDYDLSSEERHLARSTELQLCDALAWVRDHAADYGADAEKLYLTGGSAGGNMALELAYRINSGEYAAASDGTELPQVKAVSAMFPACSVADMFTNRDPVLGPTGYRMAAAYTGVTPEEDPALFRSLEPVNHISKAAAPTFIMVGAGDTLVPPQATYRLHGALDAAGIPNECIVVPYGNHLMDMVDGSMLNRAYLELTLRWFERFA